MKKHPHRPEWSRRWLLIRLSLIWCALFAAWIIIWGPDDRVRETAFVGIAGLAASVICGYLGFATWDDRNFMRHLRDTSPRSAIDPPKEPEEP